MAEDLDQLHALAASMLELIEPGQRRTYMRAMATEIRKVNQRRMTAQRAPDGTAWAKRKARARQKPATRPVRFLYPSSGVGEPRLVDMRSWIGRGDMIIGFDREADGLRTFRRDRVIRWITAEGSAEGADIEPARKASRGKSPNMFRGLRSNRYLKIGATEDEAWAEFTGRAGQLARVHHDGGRDRVSPDGPEVDYTARPLLGFSQTDEAYILNRFIDRVGDAMGWSRRNGR